VVHASICDAWAAYDARAVGTRLGGALRRPPTERTLANKNAAIGHAAYRALVSLFPGQTASFDALMAALGYDPAEDAADTAPAGVGNRVAAAVLALRSAAQFRPDGPVAHVDERGRSNRADVRQARDVLRDSRQLDDRTKSIAAYWDGPSTELPPGHWCLLAQYVSRRDRHSVDQDAKLFFTLTGALLDASIAAWDAERAYDSVRPITAIRELYRGRTVLAWGGLGRAPGPSAARTGCPTSRRPWSPRRSPRTSPATRPSAPPPPRCSPRSPAAGGSAYR
jgi:hypothetical protein